jgi:hypothetical protein
MFRADTSGLTIFFTFVNILKGRGFRMTNQVRGPRVAYRIRKKLRRALQYLADGRSLREAAALTRMSAQGLKAAIQKPHVLALMAEGDRGHQRELVPKVVSTFERVTDVRLRQLRPRSRPAMGDGSPPCPR